MNQLDLVAAAACTRRTYLIDFSERIHIEDQDTARADSVQW